MPLKYLLTKDGGIKLAAADGAALTESEGGPPIVVPAATVKAAAARLGLVERAESAPGSDAWAAGLDADARASFDKLIAAGIDRDKAARVAALPAASRADMEELAIETTRYIAQRNAAEAAARETSLTAAADAYLASAKVKPRLTPAMAASVRTLYLAAARRDAANPPADGEPGELAAVEALVADIKPHAHTGRVATGEALPAGAKVLGNDGAGASAGAMTPERRRQLLSSTPEGRQALRRTESAAKSDGHA